MLFICMMMANETVLQPDSLKLDECISKIAGRDKDALAELYRLTDKAVYGFALSILKNAHEAEDVLHDTYMSIFSNAGSYVSGTKPMAWIMTITKNLCYMRFRADKKVSFILEEDWENYMTENGGMSDEDRLILRECMTLLSEEERKIVVLHIVAGLKHREIAQFLSLALPTVLSKYSRALKKLRKVLSENNETTEEGSAK